MYTTASPAGLKLTAGQSGGIQVCCGSVQGTFAGPVTLSVSGAPAGVTIHTGSPSLAAGSSASLNIGSTLNTAPGTYNLSLTASATGFTQTLAIPLIISTPSTFTLAAAQSELTVRPGGTGQLGLITAHFGAFNSAVNLNCTGLPAGITASFSKTTLAAPGDGRVIVNFFAVPSAKPGTYRIPVTGTGGGQTQIIPVKLIIPANADFFFALNVSSLNVQQGGTAGTVTVSTGNFTGGFNSTITITLSGLAPRMNYGATGASTSNNLVNTPIGVTASSATPAGTYPITITASGAGVKHSAIVQVNRHEGGCPNSPLSDSVRISERNVVVRYAHP